MFCDYSNPDFSCKPEREYYDQVRVSCVITRLLVLTIAQALKKAGVTDPSKCYFVDDSRINVDAAKDFGWGHCIHFCEQGLTATEGGIEITIGHHEELKDDAVANLDDLRKVWSELFKG